MTRTESTRDALRKPTARSRITNGVARLPRGTDGRSTWCRRVHDLMQLHLADLGGDAASEGERSIVRRIAVLTVELERLEMRFATCEDAPSRLDLDAYIRGSGNLRRLLQTVGIRRRVPKDITPSPIDYARRER